MASLREIRRKIKSVRQTQQVTKAMKMIAASRLKRAQGQLLASRPYAKKVAELTANLSAQTSLSQGPIPELLKPRPGARDSLILLLSSDKGLCGSYNTALLRHALKLCEELRGKGLTPKFFAVGKKGRDFLAGHNFPIEREYVQFLRTPTYSQAKILAKDILDHYLAKPETGRADVVFMDFRSVLRQIPAIYPLLPPLVNRAEAKDADSAFDYIYEPNLDIILRELLPRYITTEIYRLIFEAYTSEQASRLNIMENATRNAGELIESLTLGANKVRQDAITRELLEVVSGAEALN